MTTLAEQQDLISAQERDGMVTGMKQMRNERLQDSDWSVLPDNGLSEEAKAEWMAYRQTLRDLSNHEDWPFIEEDDLPTSPSGMPFAGAMAIPFVEEENVPSIAVAPSIPAPSPTLEASAVHSVWGDTYSNITIHEINPQWQQAGQAYEEMLLTTDGTPFTALRIEDLNWQGMNIADFGQQSIIGTSASGYACIHLNFWLGEDQGFRFGLVSHDVNNQDEYVQRLVNIRGTAGWNSVNISLSDFVGVDTSNITQMILDNLLSDNSTGIDNFWLDNIYFNNQPETEVVSVSDT